MHCDPSAHTACFAMKDPRTINILWLIIQTFYNTKGTMKNYRGAKSQILTLSVFLTFQLQSKQQNMLAEEKPTYSDDSDSLEAKLEILEREIEELSQE